MMMGKEGKRGKFRDRWEREMEDDGNWDVKCRLQQVLQYSSTTLRIYKS